MRREWIEIYDMFHQLNLVFWSPSMRREWIEIAMRPENGLPWEVSLHAEGVD